MTITIDQFMWGFQPHFRISVQLSIQRTLSKIGLQSYSQAKVLLIGLASRNDLQHQFCIEPERGPLVVSDFCSLERRTEEIYRADPSSQVSYSDPRIHALRRRGGYLQSRAHAIGEAIEATGKFDGLTFFVSGSAPIAGYDVHTCIGVPSEAIASAPRFNNLMKDNHHGRHIEESFVEAVIHTCLAAADRALYLPDPGAGAGFEVLGDVIDIIRRSAQRFVGGIVFSLTPLSNDLFDLTNQFSSLTYERSGARGCIAVTHPDNLTSSLKVAFQTPISLDETRTIRKMLELTDESTHLLADYVSVYGLGKCNSAPDVAEISIEGHARWSIGIDGRTLMRVNYEHATLPKSLIDKDRFRDIAERTVRAEEVDRIWEIVQSALETGHGTTIVISEDPTSEVQRLARESLPIEPRYLEPEEVVRLGRVDGAIILGRDGRCYSFGAILDGRATSSGNRARGARFNSSVRYQETSKIGTMVIIISDDGSVDVVPSLMPRVWREDVEEAIHAFCELSGNQDSDGEEWARLNSRVEEFSFYLNEQQCNAVNECYAREMDSRPESGGISRSRKRLQPNAEMNDSYFWDSGSAAT